jgi:hypothetical protein
LRVGGDNTMVTTGIGTGIQIGHCWAIGTPVAATNAPATISFPVRAAIKRELNFTESGHVEECSSMIATGAYGERMAYYLHLADPPIRATLGFGRSELAVTRPTHRMASPIRPALFHWKKPSQFTCISALTGEAACGSPANGCPPANDPREG